ncbi:MAG: DNA-directed RNA polymerase subunit K [Candidatus Pacearchaeota archaeon]|jgi:DNA-directed RNA polymerase subunit K
MQAEKFTKYEKARILGARALQIAMNAPLLIKISNEDLEKIKFDALKIAEIELSSDVLPISIKKPFPQKKEEQLKRPKPVIITEEKKEETESEEEKEIIEEGEIMELAEPEEEKEDFAEDDSSGGEE